MKPKYVNQRYKIEFRDKVFVQFMGFPNQDYYGLIFENFKDTPERILVDPHYEVDIQLIGSPKVKGSLHYLSGDELGSSPEDLQSSRNYYDVPENEGKFHTVKAIPVGEPLSLEECERLSIRDKDGNLKKLE